MKKLRENDREMLVRMKGEKGEKKKVRVRVREIGKWMIRRYQRRTLSEGANVNWSGNVYDGGSGDGYGYENGEQECEGLWRAGYYYSKPMDCLLGKRH